jgi:hypothetical protein
MHSFSTCLGLHETSHRLYAGLAATTVVPISHSSTFKEWRVDVYESLCRIPHERRTFLAVLEWGELPTPGAASSQ